MFKAEIVVGYVGKMCVESGKIEENYVENNFAINKLLIVEKEKNVEYIFLSLSGQPII